jgi:hypothetical protein
MPQEPVESLSGEVDRHWLLSGLDLDLERRIADRTVVGRYGTIAQFRSVTLEHAVILRLPYFGRQRGFGDEDDMIPDDGACSILWAQVRVKRPFSSVTAVELNWEPNWVSWGKNVIEAFGSGSPLSRTVP